LQLSARGLRLMPSPSLRPRRDLEVGHVDALLELRVVERDLHAQRPEALDALQLPELEALDRAGQIAEALQVLDVRPVLQRLGGLIVDDRSEERRVGKECRSRWWTLKEKEKKRKLR